MQSKTSFRKYWENCVHTLKICATYAVDREVILGIENTVLANFLDSPEELKKMMDRCIKTLE